jgi:BirA family biotin operon repressor/biotin-[acetyl-CoA-carboxylase] ligase
MFFRNSLKHLPLQTIDSTQAFAKREYKSWNLSDMYIITAQEQTAGQGTFNKQWISPPDVNLYGTFVISVPLYFLTLVQNLSKVLILSIVQALHDIPVSLTIKWPNDLMIHKKKCGGLLTETKTDGERLIVFLGFGLNVNMKQEDLLSINQAATSLSFEIKEPLDKEHIQKKINLIFLRNFKIFKEKGLSPFLKKFRSHLDFIGYPFFHEQTFLGTAVGIDDQGLLQVKTCDGQIKSFASGSIQINHGS